MKHIALLVMNNNMGSSLIAPLEILSKAGERVALRISVVTPTGGPVVSRSGLSIEADCAIAQVGHADAIIVTSCPDAAALSQELCDDAIAWLVEQHRLGRLIGAIDSGIFMLGLSGFLDGKQAAADWHAVANLRDNFPLSTFSPEQNLVGNSAMVTGAGGYAGEDVALFVLDKLLGGDVARETARDLMINVSRAYQAHSDVMQRYRAHNDDRIMAVQAWLDLNYMHEISIESMARSNYMSSRNFVRRFKDACGESPLTYIQRLRVEQAKRLLEQTSMTVEEVSVKVGYQTESYFRKLFKRYTSKTPAQYRDSSTAAVS